MQQLHQSTKNREQTNSTAVPADFRSEVSSALDLLINDEGKFFDSQEQISSALRRHAFPPHSSDADLVLRHKRLLDVIKSLFHEIAVRNDVGPSIRSDLRLSLATAIEQFYRTSKLNQATDSRPLATASMRLAVDGLNDDSILCKSHHKLLSLHLSLQSETEKLPQYFVLLEQTADQASQPRAEQLVRSLVDSIIGVASSVDSQTGNSIFARLESLSTLPAQQMFQIKILHLAMHGDTLPIQQRIETLLSLEQLARNDPSLFTPKDINNLAEELAASILTIREKMFNGWDLALALAQPVVNFLAEYGSARLSGRGGLRPAPRPMPAPRLVDARTGLLISPGQPLPPSGHIQTANRFRAPKIYVTQRLPVEVERSLRLVAGLPAELQRRLAIQSFQTEPPPPRAFDGFEAPSLREVLNLGPNVGDSAIETRLRSLTIPKYRELYFALRLKNLPKPFDTAEDLVTFYEKFPGLREMHGNLIDAIPFAYVGSQIRNPSERKSFFEYVVTKGTAYGLSLSTSDLERARIQLYLSQSQNESLRMGVEQTQGWAPQLSSEQMVTLLMGGSPTRTTPLTLVDFPAGNGYMGTRLQALAQHLEKSLSVVSIDSGDYAARNKLQGRHTTQIINLRPEELATLNLSGDTKLISLWPKGKEVQLLDRIFLNAPYRRLDLIPGAYFGSHYKESYKLYSDTLASWARNGGWKLDYIIPHWADASPIDPISAKPSITRLLYGFKRE